MMCIKEIMTRITESSLASVFVTHENVANSYVAEGHVIGDDYLLGFVQGTLDEAEALLVATQYHIAPEAAQRVKILADCAATSFENAQPQHMRCSAQAFFEEKCASSCEEKKQRSLKKQCAVPAPLQDFVGETYCDIKWRMIFPDIVEKVLSIKGSKLHACLIKMDKGASIPLHTHRGDAAVLVLLGAFADRGTTYQKGDVIFYSDNPDVQHNPEAMEECICFAVLHAPLQIKNRMQHVLYRIRRFIARSDS